MELKQVCEVLRKRGFKARVFEDGNTAADYLDSVIDATSVGFGGSVTLQEIGAYNRLARHNEVWWHWAGENDERQKAMSTEVYLSSVNGLAETGELVNIDGIGNRAASTLYGHKRLYFVIGQNKLAPTYEEALWRARNLAAPRNAKRLGVKTPCAIRADHCYDCDSPERICRGLVVLWRPMTGTDTEVLLVRQNLGL